MRVQLKVRIAKTKRDGSILKWTDDMGIARQQRCTGGTQRARETERRRLEEQLNDRSRDMTWDDFWGHALSNYLSGMSSKHTKKCRTMHRRLGEAAQRLGVGRFRCSDVSPAILLECETELRRLGNEPATIKSNMDTLWSLLTWGQGFDLVPDIQRPRRRRGKKAKQDRKSKGRSLTMEEIERMEQAMRKVCKSFEPVQPFLDAMHAMQLIGMRLTEVWLFAWEPLPGAHYPVRLNRSNPAIQFNEIQKSGVDEEVPLTPEAADWLRKVERRASPWVCRTVGQRGEHKTPTRLGRAISEAGKKANVVVKRKADGSVKKCASAHDLRRTFAAMLHHRLNVSELQKMTRHANASTLLDYYADASTPVLMDKLRG